ncbi:hypothetical protein HM1_2549 [Heliomicrobium modesticaldum Ice1]|uniref:Periplasmic immunogenic protein n=1 Tax=Heliobacterium modesticaldum (strain ATCC 51547 / Ice1) TaxID=498761 RepID=B0TAX5_HELMI|nr:SIMPL domain-containing protein [Heliomicrobium modesticaldum]ABZ85086.1 hypothetical protein HM1_2549 [Heliomicrobium modesticaldum Ice1]
MQDTGGLIATKNRSTANKVALIFFSIIVLTAFYLSTHRVPAPPLDSAIAVDPRDVHIKVTGTSDLPAELWRLTVAVQQGGRTSNEAVQAMRRSVEKLLDSMTDAGLSPDNINCVDQKLTPQWSVAGTKSPQGYIAASTIEVNGIPAEQREAILSTALANGANQIIKTEPLAVGNADVQKLAVKAALDDAHRKAKAIAAGMGRDLGDVVSIDQAEIDGHLQLTVLYRLKF